MTELLFPIYIQKDALDTLYSQITSQSMQSKKVGKTTDKDHKNGVSAKFAASLLKVIGVDLNVSSHESNKLSLSTEEVFVLDTLHKAKQFRKYIRSENMLSNLNVCLSNHLNFGAFVDFQMTCGFSRRKRLVEILGQIENVGLSTICSPEYFGHSKSTLFQLLDSGNKIDIKGFGVILGIDEESKNIVLKSLILALMKKDFFL